MSVEFDLLLRASLAILFGMGMAILHLAMLQFGLIRIKLCKNGAAVHFRMSLIRVLVIVQLFYIMTRHLDTFSFLLLVVSFIAMRTFLVPIVVRRYIS